MRLNYKRIFLFFIIDYGKNLMRKSLVLLLTFFLTSYSKFGKAFQFDMNELETTVTITEDECLDVLEYGNLIASAFRDITKNEMEVPKSRIYHNVFMSFIIYRGFIYEVKMDTEEDYIRCLFKYKLLPM